MTIDGTGNMLRDGTPPPKSDGAANTAQNQSIQILENQLKIKDEQIKAKDEQIVNLFELLKPK